MLCEQHFKALTMARKKQEIMLKYVQEARTTYLAVNAVQASEEDPPAAPRIQVNPVSVLGLIT